MVFGAALAGSRFFTSTQRQYSSTGRPSWSVPVVRRKTMPVRWLDVSLSPMISECAVSVSLGITSR